MLFSSLFFFFKLRTVHKFPVLILLVDFSRLAEELRTERGSCLTPAWLCSFETPSWAQLLPAALDVGR